MSRTSKPLRVLVHPTLWNTAGVDELRGKQNEVHPMETTDFDLILSPTAWRIVPGMEGQIDLAVKAARKAKYGKKRDDDGE